MRVYLASTLSFLCIQVVSVAEEENEEGRNVVMWTMKWYAPIPRTTGGAGQPSAKRQRTTDQPARSGSHKDKFYAQPGRSAIEADDDVLVAVFPKLNNDGKLPDKVKKDALSVLKAAIVSHANGNIVCVQCNVADDDELVACDCCSRKFHVRCAGDACMSDTWWCPSCEQEVQ